MTKAVNPTVEPARVTPIPANWVARMLATAGLLPAPGPDEPPPAATAVLLTSGDLRIDWLRAGQAVHRVLAHAATAWVSASLNTEPLEFPVIRDLIRTRLGLPGAPQMLLQFGLARTSLATPRRTVPEFLA